MTTRIKMPTLAELPDGPRRAFVECLFTHYRAASRPSLRTVSDWIDSQDNLTGTASRETVRRMLTGVTVPAQWGTAQAVYLALRNLAESELNVSPTKIRTFNDSEFKELWNNAIDDAEIPSNSKPNSKTFDAKPVTWRLAKNDVATLKIGDRVKHDKYGPGTVIDTDSSSRYPTVVVNFGSEGTVRLMLMGSIPMIKL